PRICAEDEYSRAPLGHDLEECLHRVRTAHAQPLHVHGERVSELRGLAKLALEVLPLDVAVPEETPGRGEDRRGVDHHERLPALAGRVDSEHRRLLDKRDVERGEEHRTTSGTEE